VLALGTVHPSLKEASGNYYDTFEAFFLVKRRVFGASLIFL
jgi:hypothetical protein